jgi:hypothetical protein
MEKQLRLRELPELCQRRITRALCTGDRVKITDARGIGIAWIIGRDDVDNLRDCDRIARRLNNQFAQRVDELSERINATPGIGRKLTPRVRSRLTELRLK